MESYTIKSKEFDAFQLEGGSIEIIYNRSNEVLCVLIGNGQLNHWLPPSCEVWVDSTLTYNPNGRLISFDSDELKGSILKQLKKTGLLIAHYSL